MDIHLGHHLSLDEEELPNHSEKVRKIRKVKQDLLQNTGFEEKYPNHSENGKTIRKVKQYLLENIGFEETLPNYSEKEYENTKIQARFT